MRVLVSGSSGLVGRALCRRLADRGDDVVVLSRPASGPAGGTPTVPWDPSAGTIDADALVAAGPYDAVVNLAGAGIGDRRWSDERRRLIMSSRVLSTSLLATTLPGLRPAPAVFVSASAVGYYGDRGDEELTEQSGPGRGFLVEVVKAWEDAARPAAEQGARVVLLRTSVVLDPGGGVLGRLLPLFRVGLGGRLADGGQFMSWITLHDEVSAILAALERPELEGPLNLGAPTPVTNREFTEAVGRALHRPTVLAAPRAALELALGRDMASEMLLASQRMVPARLVAAGHRFDHPDIDTALTTLLARAT